MYRDNENLRTSGIILRKLSSSYSICCPSISYESLVSSGGVGLNAKGYSFASRLSSGRGFWKSNDGYDRLVVVVVVTVFVSIISSNSTCNLDVCPTVSSPSCHPRETVWLGCRVSTLWCNNFEFEVEGLGEASDIYFWGPDIWALWESVRCLLWGLLGGSILLKFDCAWLDVSRWVQDLSKSSSLPLSFRPYAFLTRGWPRESISEL